VAGVFRIEKRILRIETLHEYSLDRTFTHFPTLSQSL
jgi:hypothetical protein